MKAAAKMANNWTNEIGLLLLDDEEVEEEEEALLLLLLLLDTELVFEISRLRSLLVCSNVLLRISLSAVRLTLKLTSSSYFLLNWLTSLNICSGDIFSMADKEVSCGLTRVVEFAGSDEGGVDVVVGAVTTV